MTLFIAIEFIPYEGDIFKGVFTTLFAAFLAAVHDKTDHHIGKVYQVEVNQTLSDGRERDQSIVWTEGK